jgi:hypothetical protein
LPLRDHCGLGVQAPSRFVRRHLPPWGNHRVVSRENVGKGLQLHGQPQQRQVALF